MSAIPPPRLTILYASDTLSSNEHPHVLSSIYSGTPAILGAEIGILDFRTPGSWNVGLWR